MRFSISFKILHNQGLKMTFLRTSQTYLEYRTYKPLHITVSSMLFTLPEKYKSSWKSLQSIHTIAYNCTRHRSAWDSPYCLEYGSKARLPKDFILLTEKVSPPRCNCKEYLESWMKEMKEMKGAFYVGLTKFNGRKCAEQVEVKIMPRFS